MASPPSSLLSRVVGHDAAVSLRLHTAFLPVPRFLLKALEVSGDGRLWFPLLLAVLPLFPSSPIPLGLLLGSLLDLLLVGLIKHLVRRPRPLYNKGMSLVFAVDHWSFPSGHSSRVLFIACFIFLSSAYGDLLAVYWDLRNSWIWGWCRDAGWLLGFIKMKSWYEFDVDYGQPYTDLQPTPSKEAVYLKFSRRTVQLALQYDSTIIAKFSAQLL